MRDVVVVDKSFVASGATGKSSACVRQHYSTAGDLPDDPLLARLLRALRGADRRRLVRLPAHRATCSAWTSACARPWRSRWRSSAETGIDTRLVSPDEMREIEPRLRTEDLGGRAATSPTRATATPSRPRRASRGRPARAGARFLEDTEVLGHPHRRRPRHRRATSRGPIHAPRVVNAAGLWGARVGAMVGLEIPISVCRHKISIVSWPEAAAAAAPHGLRLRDQHLHAAGAGRAHPRGRPRARGGPRPRRPRPLSRRA